jgi:hypothetical protein
MSIGPNQVWSRQEETARTARLRSLSLCTRGSRQRRPIPLGFSPEASFVRHSASIPSRHSHPDPPADVSEEGTRAPPESGRGVLLRGAPVTTGCGSRRAKSRRCRRGSSRSPLVAHVSAGVKSTPTPASLPRLFAQIEQGRNGPAAPRLFSLSRSCKG